MYNSDGRRHNNNPYGSERSNYGARYTKNRQNMNNYADRPNNRGYHQRSFEDDSYFGGQKNATFQYTQFGDDDFDNIKNGFKNEYSDRVFDNRRENGIPINNQYNNGYSYNNLGSNTRYNEINNNNSSYNNANYNNYGNNQYGNIVGDTNYSNNGYNDYSKYMAQNNYSNVNNVDKRETYSNNNYNAYNASDYSNTVYNESDNMGQGEYGNDVDCEITVLHPTKSHVILENVVLICVLIFIGVSGGKLMQTVSVFSNFWNEHVYNENLLKLIIKVLGILLCFVMSYILHTVIHEFGHLVGGALSGYSLISFRIFSIVLIRENKKFSIKKYSVPNTVGECVMMPPIVKKGKYPYKLYRLGGIAMNIISSVVFLALVFGINALSKYPWNMMAIIFAIVGLLTAIYNGIPIIIEGVPNDGYLMLHMLESKEARLAVHSQLLIYAFLTKGGTYADVPYEQFCISQTDEIKNYLVAKVKLLEYRWHLEHLDFKQAAKCLEATNQFFHSLPKIHQYEINSEKMFIEIMCEHDMDIIDKLYTSDVKRYVAETQNVLTRNRILMAYEAGVKNDPRVAHKHYMQIKNSVKTYPIKGEAELEVMISDYVYEKFCSK